MNSISFKLTPTKFPFGGPFIESSWFRATMAKGVSRLSTSFYEKHFNCNRAMKCEGISHRVLVGVGLLVSSGTNKYLNNYYYYYL